MFYYTVKIAALCVTVTHFWCSMQQHTAASGKSRVHCPGTELERWDEGERQRPTRKWLSPTCRLSNHVFILVKIHFDTKSPLTFHVQLLFKKKEIAFGHSMVVMRNTNCLVRVHKANLSGAPLCSCMYFTPPAVPALARRAAGFKDFQQFWGLGYA